MKLDIDKLAADMTGAIKKVLEKKWPEIGDYAEVGARNLAEALIKIEKSKLTGELDEKEAKIHLFIQKNAAGSMLLAIEGLGILAAEEAINAAFQVVKDTVNTALGFSLL
ncbi:MAG TPA: hypothetical protein ENH35_03285 [Candidatus Moranbacteria bacterium]|nr:hypothetical protein [Candidatus Moranbacteria bacterium]